MSWIISMLNSDRQLQVLAGMLVVAAVPLVLAAAVAWWHGRRGTGVWRLHVVRLGFSCWDAGYKHDWMARHWWLDCGRWRVALIRRHVQRARWRLRLRFDAGSE